MRNICMTIVTIASTTGPKGPSPDPDPTDKSRRLMNQKVVVWDTPGKISKGINFTVPKGREIYGSSLKKNSSFKKKLELT